MNIFERPQWFCGAKEKWALLKRGLLACAIIVVLGSCNAPPSNPDTASNNGSDTISDNRQGTTVLQTAEAEETTTSSSSLTVTTTDTEVAEDLTFIDIDGDGNSDARAYLRYENYLERQDMSSVYIWIAVSSSDSSRISRSGSELMSDILERLPDYDFVLLSFYEDDTGEYQGPVTYTANAEVAEAYKNHLYEYADEFARAVQEGDSPSEIERYEEYFREEVIPLYRYEDSDQITDSQGGPNIPPWVYSDTEAETLGALPGSAQTIEQTIGNTITDHYEAIQNGNFEEAYSYFSSAYRSKTDMDTWTEEQESNKVDTIHDLGAEVEVTSQDTATATIRVSFEDSIYQCDNIYLCTNPSSITWEMVRNCLKSGSSAVAR
jgi:hypothetical protein